jgi:hypothetical protein
MLYVQYREYPERWDEIAKVFAHDAVWRGDYDRYALAEGARNHTMNIDGC